MTREQMITTLQLLGYVPCRSRFSGSNYALPVSENSYNRRFYAPATWGEIRDEQLRYTIYFQGEGP